MTEHTGLLQRADDATSHSPPEVLAAMGFGFVPVPFLAMYAILFISRGFIVPVSPPDVTGSSVGEGLVGVGAVVLIVALSVVIAWLVAGRRRWPFVIMQLAVLGFGGYCLSNRDTGPIWIPLLMLVCSVVAIGCAFLPASHRRFATVRLPRPRRKRAVDAPTEADVAEAHADASTDADEVDLEPADGPAENKAETDSGS